MSDVFAERHVVVTGGTGALGRAVVTQLLDQGAHCHVPVFHDSEMETSPHRDHDAVSFVPGVNLAEEASARSYFGACPPLWASIHLAGGFRAGRIEETSAADFVRLMDLNVLTCFLSCREAVERIRATGAGGRIVNVSARAAVVPAGGSLAYAVAKGAVATLTTTLAAELAPERIWVNAVIPSIMDTPANRAAMPQADHGRWPKVDEVAATIVYLASSTNALTNGALVPVYGRT